MIPALRQNADPGRRKKLLEIGRALGISEESIRLSIIQLLDSFRHMTRFCAAAEDFESQTRSLLSLQGLREREEAQFARLIERWLPFTEKHEESTRRRSTKKRRRQKRAQPKRRKAASVAETVLRPIRNSLRSRFVRLKKKGYRFQIASDAVRWKGDLALWLRCDVDHPVKSASVAEIAWQMIEEVFQPYRWKTKQRCVVDFWWSQIALVPTVAGKSLGRQVFPHLHGATVWENTKLEEQLWRVTPEEASAETWSELHLEEWRPDSRLLVFARAVAAYATLLQHVEHMADFRRLPNEIEEEGFKLLQTYLEKEEERVQPILQDVFDRLAESLAVVNSLDEGALSTRPNLLHFVQAMQELQELLLPVTDFQDSAKITLDQMVEWRDRLRNGLGIVGIANMLWTADVYGFPAYEDFLE